MDTVNRWHFVLESGHWGKVTLQPSVVPLPSLFSHISLLHLPLHLYLSLLPLLLFLEGGITSPLSFPVSLFSSSYLSSISILLTQFSSTLLIFSFIFLPVFRPHLSLSHRMLKSQWTGYKNMDSTSEKESVILSSFRPTGLVLIFQGPLFFSVVWFQRHYAVTLLSCKKFKRSQGI